MTYFEERMFAILPQIYPKDFVDFFIRNYLRFLGDIFHKWLMQFNIQDFYKIINELDQIYNLFSKNLTQNKNFLDISLKIINCILMYTINLQILLVIFTIKVVTHHT